MFLMKLAQKESQKYRKCSILLGFNYFFSTVVYFLLIFTYSFK
jgi:hypothetical protein